MALLDGYVPWPGIGFSIVSFATYDGAFTSMYLPPLGFGHWVALYNTPPGWFSLTVAY